MSKWGGTYTVGESKPIDFPMALFSKIGGTGNIVFELSAAKALGPSTLRVGTTLAFKGGRPSPRIGSWTGTTSKIPKNLNSRGITRGGYRGFGEMYEFHIPAGVLKAGRNTLTLGVSGTGDAGYLSANYIIDAVELIKGS
jgi:rhamnogalacturonan endolyase